MSRKIVHVIGTGTIGEPLIGLLCDYKNQLGVDEVTFHKNSPLKSDRPKIHGLVHRGARLATDENRNTDFRKLGMDPELETEEAIRRASVVIDCTPKGIGNYNKQEFYHRFEDTVNGFIAQGSEDGFGKKYARGVNDRALVSGRDKYLQIVSCNTHNLACIAKTLALYNDSDPDNLLEARFVCVRRANDLSQVGNYIPAPQVGKHSSDLYGSHHAVDAAALFKTLNMDLNLFSSAMKVNSQYMHVLWFNLKVKEPVTLNDVKDRLRANLLVAMTTKDMTSTVFSFGRDQGHYGRILNQTVVVEQTLNVRKDHEISGFCFTPQDGNSLLSSISGAEWLMFPHSYEDKIQCLGDLFFQEI
ncbi:MAG: hypothetical protein HQ528_04560 [Candidatus Marinimicrobia bacterium]|nr:hypothetical protein [Candidatus Neomarinimicrobiota bacterium]